MGSHDPRKSPDIAKAGKLKVLSLGLDKKNWKKFYFVLVHNTIYYYVTVRDSNYYYYYYAIYYYYFAVSGLPHSIAHSEGVHTC